MPDPKFQRRVERSRDGDSQAYSQLVDEVYGELRRLAASYLRGGGPAHTLQPTAVVHEAFVKLVDRPPDSWASRAHFFAVAARAMRQVLADHARERRALKRGGDGWGRVTLHDDVGAPAAAEFDVVALDDALAQLAQFDERKHRVVELRFLGGLSVAETADVLGLSVSTVEAEWRAARAWLATRLG